MLQQISAFHIDHEGLWVADLECGHKQHMRHDPPWMNREWILSEEGRRGRLGSELACKLCDALGASIAESVRDTCIEAAREQFEDAGVQGLCLEGRLEVAMDKLKKSDLTPVIEKAIRQYLLDSLKP